MLALFELFKKTLKISNADDEDDLDLQKDLQEYTSVIYSHKYADSNADTTAVEKLLKSMMDHRSIGTVDSCAKQTEEAESKMMVEEPKPETQVDRTARHIELVDLLNKEEILPGQPTFIPAKFSIGSTNFVLPQYKLPREILQAVQNNDVRPLKLYGAPDPTDYVKNFHTLLWIEEAQQDIEMRRYDQFGCMLSTQDGLYCLQVPGLAEGRPSLLRGDRLVLRSDKRSSLYEGYIHQVRERDILIKLHESLHYGNLDGLRFDISFLSSRTPFRRCHHAVEQYHYDKELELPKIVFPSLQNQNKEPRIEVECDDSNNLQCFNTDLNQFQKKAVLNVIKHVARPSPYIVWGPPGTGKTVTLCEIILQILNRSDRLSRILVCGNSNACADIIATKLKRSGKVPKDEMIRLSAFYRMATMIPGELKDITKCMEDISLDMYRKCRIFVSTCIQTGALNDFNAKFDYVIIDEAGHASEPEALIPISLLRPKGTIVMAGDFKQLGPVCFSKIAVNMGLGLSLLERLSFRAAYTRRMINGVMTYDERYLTKLIISYRSDPRVMVVNNELFYNNELKFTMSTPKRFMDLLQVDRPTVFHQVKGRDRREFADPSWFNVNEAITCLSYVTRLYRNGLKPTELGIISPYRRQIDKIGLLFDSCNLTRCKIGTMEEFQGDEREIIIISTVRAREKNLKMDELFQLGFLFDQKRFNVATSRAKWLTIVVGDSKILMRDECWVKFIEKAHKIGEIEPVSKQVVDLDELS